MYPSEKKYIDEMAALARGIVDLQHKKNAAFQKRLSVRYIIEYLKNRVSYGEDDFDEVTIEVRDYVSNPLSFEEIMSIVEEHWMAAYESRLHPVKWKDSKEEEGGMYYSVGTYDDSPHDVQAMHHTCAKIKTNEMDNDDEFTEPWEPFADDGSQICELCNESIEVPDDKD